MASSRMRAGRTMVRANGQRDGVGRTSLPPGASEHAQAIVDPTRVSPYRPAGRDIPQSMRPDTRQHLTACTGPSVGDVNLAHGQPRPSTRFAAPPLRSGPSGVTAAAGRAGTLVGQPEGWPFFNGSTHGLRKPLRRSGESAQQNSRTRSRRRSLHSRRRPHTVAWRPDDRALGGAARSSRRKSTFGASAATATCRTSSVPWTLWHRPTGWLLTWRNIGHFVEETGSGHSRSSTANGTIPRSGSASVAQRDVDAVLRMEAAGAHRARQVELLGHGWPMETDPACRDGRFSARPGCRSGGVQRCP